MKILITGASQEDKSTLASEIQALFESLGFGVEQLDPDVAGRTPQVHESRLSLLRHQGLQVTIQTVTQESPPVLPASCDDSIGPVIGEALMEKKVPSVRDLLPNSLAEMCEDDLAQRVRRSYLVQNRVEQRRRLKYVVSLSAEQARIEKQTVFATAWGLMAIEAVMEGNWDEALDIYEDLGFQDKPQEVQQQHAEYWRVFRAMLKAAYDTRPIQGVQQPTH